MFEDFEQFMEKIAPDPISWFFPLLMYRKGGNALDWATPGTSNYTSTQAIMQAGAYRKLTTGATSGSFTITYRTKYQGAPLLFVHPIELDPVDAGVIWYADPGEDNFLVRWKSDVALLHIVVAWLAIGGKLKATE
jgi:hypothetical protein